MTVSVCVGGVTLAPFSPCLPSGPAAPGGPCIKKKKDDKDSYRGIQSGEHFSILTLITFAKTRTSEHKAILTLFPGGPEGPDSPVGPGEP